MKKSLYFIYLIILSTYTVAQQVPSIQWQKTYGDYLDQKSRMVIQTKDGGFLIGGDYIGEDDGTGYQDRDCWIVKTDGKGNEQWEKDYGSGGPDDLNFIQTTSDGGYIFAALTNIANDKGSHSWLVKLDGAGNIEWEKTIGGTKAYSATCVRQTKDGGYIVAGITLFKPGNFSNEDYWIIKFDSLGNFKWQKTYGGKKDDEANNILQTIDGGYIVSGISFSNDGDITQTHGGGDYWIIKLDTAGNMQWQKTYGGSKKDVPADMIQTPDGGYVIAGYSFSDNGTLKHNYGESDAWVFKINTQGKLKWQKNFGGTGYDYAEGIIKNTDGSFTIAAYTSSTDDDVSFNHGTYDCWILNINNTGKILWQKSLGGSDWDIASNIIHTPDGGYAVSAYTYSTDGDITKWHGGVDYWLIKLSAETLKNAVSDNSDSIRSSLNNINAVSKNVHLLYVSPNPAKNNFRILLNTISANKLNAILYDVQGKAVWSSGLMNASSLNNKVINTASFTSGVYYLK